MKNKTFDIKGRSAVFLKLNKVEYCAVIMLKRMLLFFRCERIYRTGNIKMLFHLRFAWQIHQASS